jgi:hypothetical protein
MFTLALAGVLVAAYSTLAAIGFMYLLWAEDKSIKRAYAWAAGEII